MSQVVLSPTVARYDLHKLGAVLGTQLPVLLRAAPAVLAGFVGDDKLAVETRLAVQLRLAKRYGCPVCRALFPPIARRVGFDDTAIQSALDGAGEGLSAQAGAALAWVDALLGEPAAGAATASPEPTASDDDGAASGLSTAQREHLRFMVGLESVIHSVGLAFLPHALIEHAARP